MLRALVFILVLGLVVWGAVWLADDPGTVALEWGGYRVDTSFALLLAAVAAIAMLTALVYRFWIFLRRAPSEIKWAWRTKRRQRGYQALTRGMVAVAAGDGQEARRQVKRADVLLNEPPLTMLVSAQAAQMNGDEKAAGKFFAAMTERPETEFLGLRGLLNQAMKRGDNDAALTLARRAYRLQPKSEWVAANMFDLQTKTGQWLDARVTCDDLQRQKLIDAAQARRRKAVLSYQLSVEATAAGADEDALDHLREANKLAPDFIPAVTGLARRWIAMGKRSKVTKMIERTWAAAPHPDLVPLYWRAAGADDALERVRATERLAKHNPGNLESMIALGGASLEARLWGEARNHLGAAIDAARPGPPPARVCRMMAELEESEGEDPARAREWLMRASRAGADPTWVCGHCGNAVSEWSVVCGKCEGFDSFSWATPPSIAGLPAEEPPPAKLETAAASPTALPPRGIEAG